MHCIYITEAKLVMDTAKIGAISNTQQEEISAQSDGRVTISSQEIQTSGKWQTMKSVTTSKRGSQWNTLQIRRKESKCDCC